MKYTLLAGVAMTVLSSPVAFAAEEESDEEENKVTITGSRIKRSESETAMPVIIIDVEDLENAGFSNVFDALKELSQATGFIVGEQSANALGGTAAQAVNIRGFGPGRTLALLNGRRVTDNPTASYTGGSFFNWAIIPLAAVERIEILTGGASAIYGSDAVAGVINVILKNDLDEVMVTARYGETPEGGGESSRLQLIGGDVGENYSFTYALELQDQKSIQGLDRAHLDSALDDPNLFDGATPAFSINSWHLDYDTFSFVNPSDEECASVGATVSPYIYNPGLGNVCVDDTIGEYTIRNPRKRNSAIFNFNYTLNSDTEFFARGLYWDSETNNQIFRKWLQVREATPSYPIYGVNSVYTFHPDVLQPSSFYEQSTYVAVAGLTGMWGDMDWETGINYSRSTQFDKNNQFKQLAEYELSQITDGSPWADYSLDDLSADSIGWRTTDAESSSLSLDFILSGILMELDAGDVLFSAITEYQHTEYDIEVDEIAQQGQDVLGGWTNGSADFGAGERDRYAIGFEVAIPVTETLEVGLATRYDDYSDGSSVGGRLSSQINFSYRPIDQVLVRSSFSESFRAPDMHYLFRERFDAYLDGPTDTTKCRYADETNSDPNAYPGCLAYEQTNNIRYLAEGNPDLKEESGENIGFGVVLDFTEDFSMTVDYYKITLDDQVAVQQSAALISAEANCWLGSNRNGDQSYDPNSAECQEAFQVVEREAPSDDNLDNIITPDELGDIVRVRPSYINISSLEQSGVDITFRYELQTEDFGEFNFVLNSTNVNTYDYTLNDTTRDISLSNQEPLERINLSVTWLYDDFAASLFVSRTGGIQNDRCYTGISSNGTEYLDPASSSCNEVDSEGYGIIKMGDFDIRANLHLGYKISENLSVNMQINNITDEEGPQDKTHDWPYVQESVYNITGREVFVEARYTF